MLTEKQLDQFLDEFWEDSQSEQTEAEQETAEKDLEVFSFNVHFYIACGVYSF